MRAAAAFLVAASTLALGCGSQQRASLVTVPNVVGMNLQLAYEGLRSNGLRVTIERPFDITSSASTIVHGQAPEEGSLPKGTAIKLVPELAPFEMPPGPRQARAPSMAGLLLSRAFFRLQSSRVSVWAIHLDRLDAGAATGLFGAYRVTTQSPAPGRLGSRVVLLARQIK